TNYGAIEWYSVQAGRPVWHGFKMSVAQLEGNVQFDFHHLVCTADFPRVAVAQPVVWVLVLPAVYKRLPKHSVFVSQAVTGRRQLHGSHGIEETSRETPQAAVTKPGVRFLLYELLPVDTFFLYRLLYQRIEQKINDVVAQRAPDEKFHREVVNAL